MTCWEGEPGKQAAAPKAGHAAGQRGSVCSEDLGVRVKDEPTASRGSGRSLGGTAGDPSLGLTLQLNSRSRGRQGAQPRAAGKRQSLRGPAFPALCLPSSLVQERGGPAQEGEGGWAFAPSLRRGTGLPGPWVAGVGAWRLWPVK